MKTPFALKLALTVATIGLQACAHGLSQDSDEFKLAMNSKRYELHSCWKKLSPLKKGGDPENGQVTLHMQIIEPGVVTLAEVKSTTFARKEVGECLKTQVSEIHFPTASRSTSMDYLFQFELSRQ